MTRRITDFLLRYPWVAHAVVYLCWAGWLLQTLSGSAPYD